MIFDAESVRKNNLKLAEDDRQALAKWRDANPKAVVPNVTPSNAPVVPSANTGMAVTDP